MRSRKISLIIIYTLFCLTSLTETIYSQSYDFKSWSSENGLPDTYIYSITQDNHGFLWIGTGSDLVKFDGFNFHKVEFPDSSSGRYVTASITDRNGVLWLGCNDGALFYSEGNGLVKVSTPPVQNINQIFEANDGSVFVIPQDRMIIRINANSPGEFRTYSIGRNISMTSACLSGDNYLFLGTQENLLYCKLEGDSVKVLKQVEGIEFTKVQTITRMMKDESTFLVGTEGSGLFRLKVINGLPLLDRFRGSQLFETLDIKSLCEAPGGKFWIATYGSGLFHVQLSGDLSEIISETNYNSTNGLPGDNVKTAFLDMEENIWTGLYGEGLSMLLSDAFSYYAPSENPEQNDIIYINKLNEKYLLGTAGGYFLFNLATWKSESYQDLGRYLGSTEITAYLLDEQGLWIATRGKGLYLKKMNGSPVLFFRSENSGEDFIRHVSRKGNELWLSTLAGIVVLDLKSGAVIRRYKMEDSLPHNSINQVFIASNGDGLVATECDRIYSVNSTDGVSVGNVSMSGRSKNKVLCITESPGGDIFAGTSGNGMFHIAGDSIFNFTTADGLFSNYCYSIYSSLDGRIWIGHERGFSRYNHKKAIIRVFSTDFAGGGDCNANAIYENSDSVLMIGTTNGLIVYNKQKDRRRKTAPITNIVSVTINNVKYPPAASVTLPYNRYTIRFDYVGINLSNPARVFYNTKLDNFDEEWSELKTERSITYPLRDGRYRFNVSSVNEDGLTLEEPEYLDILIKKPFWRTWWFILIVILASAAVLFIILREREKAQKKIKEYLESELAARTRLVMQQKDEIELQNLEITDSINYAKRIQSSILPDINKLKETFSDAFILFHPRDIVSGDFYWFDKIDSERFIIVCADSTGHGVPGAFMSMIGSALLQDIISRKKITTPSEILSILDEQIFSTLNQNIDVGVSNDGMDMVVCEINTKTRHIRFASAMRPVIIVMGGESYYIKGNRCSVGGESVIEKYFDDQEYYLNEGDTIYMFSDGLPDQFGGSDGKKLKIARLKKFIEEISPRPMDEQQQTIQSFYFNWKGDYEQVDDILLMGVRL